MARPAILLGVLVTVLCYSVSLYLQPASYRDFKDMQFQFRSELGAVLIEEGVFNEVVDGLTVFVRERAADGTLEGIMVHDNRDPANPVTMMAERGALAQDEEGPKVVMAQGNRQEMNRETGKLSMLYFDRYTLAVDQLRGQGPARWRQPEERYLHELVGPDLHPFDRTNRTLLLAEANRRLALPLLGISLVLVGLATMLSGEFNRRGQSKRLFAGTAAVAGIEAASFAASSSLDDNLMYAPVLFFAVIAPGVAAAWILIRGRIGRRVPRPADSTGLTGSTAADSRSGAAS